MKNRIIPVWDELLKLQKPLTDGETQLIKFLDENLPQDWEIYVRPYCNGLQPQLVILHEQWGAHIFVVSDLVLHKTSTIPGDQNRVYMNPSIPDRSEFPDLDHIVDMTDHWEYYEDSVVNPLVFARDLRNRLLNYYLPQIGDAFGWEKQAYGMIGVSVFFPQADSSDIEDFVNRIELKFMAQPFGRDYLTPKHLATIIPNIKGITKLPNGLNRTSLASDIRNLLNPPYHRVNPDVSLELSQKFRGLAMPKAGRQRVQGCAGSGKSLLVSYRAAALASQRLRVLVLCYNITLVHYLEKLIQDSTFAFSMEFIRIMHFHGLMYEEAIRLGIPCAENAPTEFWDIQLPARLLENLNHEPSRLFDAILIDEGQDFRPEWLKLVEYYLGQRNEVLLVADRHKNIYSRDTKSTDDDMNDMGFKEPWINLEPVSFRLPNRMIAKLNEFNNRFIAADERQYLELNPKDKGGQATLIWSDLNSVSQSIDYCARSYETLLSVGVNPADIVILVPTHKTGLEFADNLAKTGISLLHLFSEEGNKQRKHKFRFDDPRAKASTIHSFKGWEARAVILVISKEIETFASKDSLVYTGLTRSQQHLIVLNLSDRYRGFGDDWDKITDE